MAGNLNFGNTWSNNPKLKPKTQAKGLTQLDIAQSHFFTIQIAGLVHPLMSHRAVSSVPDTNMHVLDLITPVYKKDENGNEVVDYKERATLRELEKIKISGYDKFLPVKSVSLTESGISTLTLPLGIFSDFPIAHRKKITRLNITIVDTDDDWYEQQLRTWYYQTVPSDLGYVGYMSDIIRELTFTSYNTKGDRNYVRRLFVMLVDDMQINRDYESNSFKEIAFSVAVVGTGSSEF